MVVVIVVLRLQNHPIPTFGSVVIVVHGSIALVCAWRRTVWSGGDRGPRQHRLGLCLEEVDKNGFFKSRFFLVEVVKICVQRGSSS